MIWNQKGVTLSRSSIQVRAPVRQLSALPLALSHAVSLSVSTSVSVTVIRWLFKHSTHYIPVMAQFVRQLSFRTLKQRPEQEKN